MRQPTSATSQDASARRSGPSPGENRAETWVRAWRLRWILVGLSLIIVGTGANIALMTPVWHVAEARLALAGGAGTDGNGQGRDGAVSAQANGFAADRVRLTGVPVADAVADRLRLERVFPELVDLPEGATRRDAVRAALLQRLAVEPGPDGTLDVRFRHGDREVASTLLSTWLDAFEAARAADLAEAEAAPTPGEPPVRPGREDTLLAEIRAFQDRHDLLDPEVELARLSAALAGLADQRRDLEAEIAALEVEALALGEALSAMPARLPVPPVPVERPADEPDRPDPLAALRLARDTLLARYLPDSRVIGAIETEIARLEAAPPPEPPQEPPQPSPKTADRVAPDAMAPNPAHQRLSAERAQVRARLRAAREALAARQSQADALQAERAQLARLLPDWRDLTTRLAAARQPVDAPETGSRPEDFAPDQGAPARLVRSAVTVNRQDPRPWILGVATLLAGLVVLVVIAAERRTARTGATPEAYRRASGQRVLAVAPRLPRVTAETRRTARARVNRRAKGG